MPDGRVLQIASTHYLGQNFSKAFEIMYLDSDGKRKHVYQTCYGPGIWRILAAVISIHGDNNGLVLPFEIAPVQVVVVPIPTKETKDVVEEYSRTVVDMLRSAGLRVEADFSDKTPGAKYYYWEMMGVPVRVEVGPREVEGKYVTLFRRDTRKRVKAPLEKMVETVKTLGDDILENLRKKAERFMNSMVFRAESMEQVQNLSKKGGFIIVPFCSIDYDGEECGLRLKQELGLEVRGVPLKNRVKPPDDARCIVCGRKAGEYVYLGKAY